MSESPSDQAETPANTPEPHAYDPARIEAKWQGYWADRGTYRAANPGEAGFDPDKPKYYVLDMFPYPSGVGLHVGHPLGFIATDIVGRFKRMTGHQVLHTMGFDAFGLPAEQYAVEHGVHPRITTEQNIANMVRQLKALGLGHDWDRSLATTDVAYYRWTQWVFLQLYHSYYDARLGKAMPIDYLVAKLKGEDYYVGLDGELIWSGTREDLTALEGVPSVQRRWHDLDAGQQRRLLDEYRLAFLAEVPVNWCPALGTVLANEEVTADGRSERGNHPVFKRPLKQWMLRITAYCDRLIDDLDTVDWPEPIKLLQRNWIGKSRGAEVDFPVVESDESIRVFTTRPDTLFGATYMVLAPEHPLVEVLTTDAQRGAVEAYQRESAAKTDVDRQADGKAKTGVFTGGHAVNPVTGEPIPVWVADYVLMGYGTGAIMAVPAHDERDYAFARQFELPIRTVIIPTPKETSKSVFYPAFPDQAYTGDGILINSANDDVTLNELAVDEAKRVITAYLEQQGAGKATTQYKLRDWLFSRQRYWGEPFPILHELGEDGERTGVMRAVDADALPVLLPEMEDFKPSGSDDPNAPVRPPLGRAEAGWRHVELDGKRYERELNTMPQWAGSCWYYLRYLDPGNDQRFVGEAAERYWMGGGGRSGRVAECPSGQDGASGAASDSATGPLDHSATSAGGVDLYVGGVEHAVLHLLYARFWHKVLFDLGHVSTVEPFAKLFSQGYIQAYAYTDERGVYVSAEAVEERPDAPATVTRMEPVKHTEELAPVEHRTTYYHGDTPVVREYGKMGKSLKNAVAPDEVCERYGADTLRLYEMYMGPLDQSKPWSTRDIVGVHRFLQRVWRHLVDAETGGVRVIDKAPDEGLHKLLHKTIAGVTEDMHAMRFNTAIAKLIELNNALTQVSVVPRAVAEAMVRMLAPLAPHVSEELWARLGHEESVTKQSWPAFDAAALVEDEVELPVQVNGKVRGKVTVPADADEAAVLAAARAAVASSIEGKTERKAIVVPGRMVNLVVGG